MYKRRTMNRLGFGLALALSATAPAYPQSGTLKPVSAEEIAAGAKLYPSNLQSQGGRYGVDPALNAYVTRVGMRLAKASEFPELPYQFTVVNNGELNAWALPGGKIAINRGLLAELADEAQLAAVLSHEISHVTRRHAARMQKKGSAIGALGAIAGIAIGMKAPQYRDLAMQSAGMVTQGFQANYSREHELQADGVGIRLMAAAGYDPAAAVELQQLFLKESQGRNAGAIAAFFASHPPSQERVTANRAAAAKLPIGGERATAAFRQATAQLHRDKAAYQNLKEAMAAYKAGNAASSASLSEKAIALQPKETLFWEMKGVAMNRLGRRTDGIAAYDRAVGAAPDFFRPYLLRGLSLKEAGDFNRAEQSLLAANRLLPTQTGVYHLGELALRKGDRDSAARHFRQAAQGGGELGQAAQRQLQAMQLP